MNKFLKLSTALCFGIILTLTLVVGAQAADMTIDGKLTVTGDIHAQSPIYLRGNNIYMTGDSGKKMLEMNNYGNSYSVYSDHQGLHIASTGDVRISDGLYTYFQGNASFENSADFQNGLSLSAVPVTASASELNVLDGVIVSTTELNYLDGVTSAVQTQLDSKFNNTGGVLSGNLSVTGTLGASGVTTLSGAANLASTLTVANASWLQDTLYVQDGASGNAISFDYDGTDLTIAYYDGASTDLVTISNAGVFTTTGGLVIGGTLDVTGAATLKSTLTTGNISAYGAGDNANLTINAKGTGTIGIGNVSSGAVTITPNTTVTGSLGVTGVINPNANITFTNNQNQNINISQSAEDIAGRDLAITAGQAGTTTGAGLAGGALYLAGGTPSTSGNAGDVWIYTDHGGSLVNGGSTHGGDIYIATGNGVGAAGNAGDIIIQPGNKAGTGSDGALLFANDKNQTIKVDQAGADTAGKELTIVSGAAGAPAAGAGLDGGNLTISAGNGSAAASGDTDGGDGGHVIISTGNGAAGSGSGESGDDGDIYLDTSEFITFGGTSSMLGDMRYDMVDGNWSRYVENPTAFNVAINAYDAVKFVDSGDAGYDNSKVGRQVIKEAGDGESHRFAGIANDDGIPIGGVGWIIVYGVVGEDDGGIVGPTDGDANAAAGDGFVLDGTAGAIRKTALATDESCGYFVEKNGASNVWIVFVRAM